MEKRMIRFKRIYVLEIDGVKKRFMSGDTVELPEDEAKKLIASGAAVPGPQHSASLAQRFEK